MSSRTRSWTLCVVGVVGVLASALTIRCTSIHPREPSTRRPAATPSSRVGTTTVQATLPAEAGPATRPVFRHSVVRGGVSSPTEARAAVATDAVVAAHYREIDVRALRSARLATPRAGYVSYRVGDRIAWTKRPVPLATGEHILTDGVHEIRGRCGNRISDTPMTPTSDDEPPPLALETVEPGSDEPSNPPPHMPTPLEAFFDPAVPIGDEMLRRAIDPPGGDDAFGPETDLPWRAPVLGGLLALGGAPMPASGVEPPASGILVPGAGNTPTPGLPRGVAPPPAAGGPSGGEINGDGNGPGHSNGAGGSGGLGGAEAPGGGDDEEPRAIPEPAATLLLTLGAGSVLWRIRMRRNAERSLNRPRYSTRQNRIRTWVGKRSPTPTNTLRASH